jgi:ubiquitin-protein ligase
MALFGNEKPPPHLKKTKVTWCLHEKDILPSQVEFHQRQSYYRALFLIEITPSGEYRFKPPEVTFLDLVYPPNIDERGCH